MDDALSLPAFVVGNAVFAVMATSFVVTLLALPMLRGVGLMIRGARWLGHLRLRSTRMPTRSRGLERPLETGLLSAPLAELARQTRILALELHRWDHEAERWPDDREAAPTRLRWLDSFMGLADSTPQTEATREVFEWLHAVETLPLREREQLASLGIDPQRVRELLTSPRAPGEQMRALVGLLWTIDARLLDAGASDYRGGAGLRIPNAEVGHAKRDESDESDDQHDQALARRRWAAVLADHGRGLSQLAARHARTPAEREDLEQDIALALWRSLPGWRGESSLKTFAYTVARYCCFGALRRRARIELDLDADASELGDPDTCVDAWLSRRDALTQLERARAELPERLASTLALRLEGMSYAEIAATQAISEQNVSVRLTRARKQLEQRLVAA